MTSKAIGAESGTPQGLHMGIPKKTAKPVENAESDAAWARFERAVDAGVKHKPAKKTKAESPARRRSGANKRRAS